VKPNPSYSMPGRDVRRQDVLAENPRTTDWGGDEGDVRQDSDDLDESQAFLPAPSVDEPIGIADRLPKAGRAKPSNWTRISFLLAVVVPTVLTSLYLYFVASPQYVSEFHFSVQSQQQPFILGSGNSAATSPGGSAALFNYLTDNYIVVDYLQSQAALDELMKRVDLEKVYAQPDFDWWYRMGTGLPAERKLRYWQSRINASFDMVTGIATVQLRAFSAQDAVKIATDLAQMSDQLVNDLQARSRNDAISFFEKEVDKAEQRLRDARAATRDFRDNEQMAAPEQSADNVVALIAKLDQELTGMRGQLATELTYMTAKAPSVVTLKQRIEATEDQINRLRAEIGATGADVDKRRLSNLMAGFDELKQNEAFAQQLYQSALTSLETARANAALQHTYVATYVEPRMAESDDGFPRKPETILVVFLVAGFVWFVGLLGTYSIRDHAI